MNKNLIKRIIFEIIVLVIWYILYYQIVYVKAYGDYASHDYFAELMFEGRFETVYPGYQLLVGIPHKLFNLRTHLVGAYVMTLIATITVDVTYKMLLTLSDKKYEIFNLSYLLAAFALNVIQPIFTSTIRPGYSSGNGYISPTQAACKPIAILVIIQTFIILKNKDWTIKSQLKLLGLTVLSCIMKPLFAMAYVPAMGLLYLVQIIRDKDKDFIRSYIKYIWPIFLTGVFLLLQFFGSFNLEMPANSDYTLSEGAEIHFGFLVGWKLVVPNIPLSIFFAYMFPIVFGLALFLYRKNCNDSFILTLSDKIILSISGFYGFVSLMIMVFLNQGPDNTFCDFRNAWVITFSLVQTFSLGLLMRLSEEKKVSKWILYLAWLCFFIHFVFGVLLYIRNAFFLTELRYGI